MGSMTDTGQEPVAGAAPGSRFGLGGTDGLLILAGFGGRGGGVRDRVLLRSLLRLWLSSSGVARPSWMDTEVCGRPGSNDP